MEGIKYRASDQRKNNDTKQFLFLLNTVAVGPQSSKFRHCWVLAPEEREREGQR